MLTGQQRLLEIAARILKPETMQAIRHLPSFQPQSWKILDRWAYNSPQKLQALERQGEAVLFDRLLRQQAIEHEVLSDLTALEQRRQGMVEHEILAANEIDTEL